MKKIIGFDSWVGGAHNYSRLVPALKDFGFELVLIHIGSWGSDIGRPKEELIDDLLVRDISFYGSRSFLKILDYENPSAVIFLSNDVFAHRAFNRYCWLRGIPTLRLYHGLVMVQSIESDRMYETNLISQLAFVMKRVPKAATKILPTYITALLKTDATISDWQHFATDAFNLISGRYTKVASNDSRTSACAVYTYADVEHAMTKYKHHKNDVHVVGNPDLSRFNLRAHDINYGALRTETNDEIVYIETGLALIGKSFKNLAAYLLFLKSLADALASQNLKLAVKLHPSHYQTNFKQTVESAGIRVVSNDDFVTSLRACRGAMVEPSTAALIPALVGIPVLMVGFGGLRSQKYGTVLTQYPRAALVADQKDVLALLEEVERRVQSGVDAWIKKNSGPLPPEKMPWRVAKILKELTR